ncbi:MAG: AAA family ATPase [Propionibacteriaceae bacterium]|nr:AAA family ATPase [Propionibacteriaceae bacterium]
MMISRLELKNWRNFKSLDVRLGSRLLVVGANATGKSNFLDAFRFLHDVASPAGGGLRAAVAQRGGLGKVRCLFARTYNQGKLDLRVELRDGADEWTYLLQIEDEGMGNHRPLVSREVVERNGLTLLDRPDDKDAKDAELRTQTALEQVSANVDFRVIADYLAAIRYTHLVPQMIRESDRVMPKTDDPFGSDFIARMNSKRINERTRRAWLGRVQAALKAAVPQFDSLEIETDDRGRPHLKAGYRTFRPILTSQDERDLSDGTLRLIGLLWSLVELPAGSTLLLEEPELSLNEHVVRVLPSVLAAAQRGDQSSQVIYTTHSGEILRDEGLQPDEVLLLQAGDDGTFGALLSDTARDVDELTLGLTIPEVISDRMLPPAPRQLALF